MSILENVKPTKSPTNFEINAYEDDIKIFNAALEFLNSKNKMTGKFTQESLFEHLTHQLRQDSELSEFVKNKSKKRGRGGNKTKSGSEKNSGVAQ